MKEVICDIVNRKMKIPLLKEEVDYTGRIGRRGIRERPAVVRLTKISKRDRILKEKRALKGTKVFIEEDLPKELCINEKALREAMYAKREEGYYAILKNGKLIVEGLEYNEEMASNYEEEIEKRIAHYVKNIKGRGRKQNMEGDLDNAGEPRRGSKEEENRGYESRLLEARSRREENGKRQEINEAGKNKNQYHFPRNAKQKTLNQMLNGSPTNLRNTSPTRFQNNNNRKGNTK